MPKIPSEFKDARILKPINRRVLTPEQISSALIAPRQQAAGASRNLRPCQLVYRNYWWQLVDGPGIVQEEHEFDDGFSDPPEFDFLTVELMGWQVIFSDSQGRPAPFPEAYKAVMAGEFPLSRRYWLHMGFIDPYLDHNTCTVQLLPWSAAIQLGFYGWQYV